MAFRLHPQLQKDCIKLGNYALCSVLLMNDSQFPWFILVPEVADLKEIYQLNPHQRGLLMEESCFLAERLQNLYNGDKINIAAIGNLVPQLHIHHVVRFHTDKAWPSPVWGKFPVTAYTEQELAERLPLITAALNLNG
ncbi:MAG: HIT domain-containing protein [Gammaproteobacteria bacterium]|nr:HIT domain-containing protein [Gammaproteobacteria bacterium]